MNIENASIKAIIFDMDGVLLLSTPAHEYAFKIILEKFGITNFVYSRFAGMRTDECLKNILNENGFRISSQEIATLAKEKSRLSNTYMKEKVPLVPGCRQLLTTLRKKRYRLALASSASVSNVELFLQSSKCHEFFEAIIYGKQVKKAKPAPDIYRMAIEKLDIEPGECLVIEDAVNGVIAAKSAGLSVYGLSGVSTENELKSVGADAVLSDIHDIFIKLADSR